MLVRCKNTFLHQMHFCITFCKTKCDVLPCVAEHFVPQNVRKNTFLHQMEENGGKSNARRSTESAGMVKLVDTPGLGPGALCHAGSSPAARKGNL